MILLLLFGFILGCLFLALAELPIYVVEVGDARMFFLSKKRADKFYQRNVELYKSIAEMDKELAELRKLVEASTEGEDKT